MTRSHDGFIYQASLLSCKRSSNNVCHESFIDYCNMMFNNASKYFHLSVALILLVQGQLIELSMTMCLY